MRWTGPDIRRIREQLGWTLEQMAQSLGINYVTLWRWETSIAPEVTGWQAETLEHLKGYAASWQRDLQIRQQAEAAAQRKASSAGDALAGVLLATGLLGLAAILYASTTEKKKPRKRRRSN